MVVAALLVSVCLVVVPSPPMVREIRLPKSRLLVLLRVLWPLRAVKVFRGAALLLREVIVLVIFRLVRSPFLLPLVSPSSSSFVLCPRLH
jgi:hypothetical protein